MPPSLNLQRVQASPETVLHKHTVGGSFHCSTQTDTCLQQRRSENLSDSLVEGVDGRVQHGRHQDALVQVVFCDDGGTQFEEDQHLLCV